MDLKLMGKVTAEGSLFLGVKDMSSLPNRDVGKGGLDS